MAAIAGIQFEHRNEQKHEEALQKMFKSMAHRGTVTKTQHIPLFGSMGCGMVTTEASIGFASEPQKLLWVVMDGEFCSTPNQNSKEGSQPDVNLVLSIYESKGDSFLEDIHGSYAIAIWDEKDRKLILARDRIGSRPLYYASVPQRLLFASEIKAILATGLCDLEIDLSALNRFLSYGYVTNPDTLFKSIKQVRPGHMVIFQNGMISEKTYWQFTYKRPTTLGFDECHERFLILLRQAVARRLNRHPDCGAFLSGGLDTSSVVALMHQLDSRPIKVFTGAFSEEEYNETPDARLVADHLGLEHHVVQIDVGKDFPDILKRIVWHHDAPFADTSAIPSYFTSKYARQYVDTVLTGDFPDQLLGGSGHHVKALERQQADSLLHGMLRARLVHKLITRLPLMAGTTSLPDRIQRMLYRESFPLDEQRVILDMPIPELLKRCLYTTDFMAVNRLHDPLALARAQFDQVRHKGLLDRLLYFDVLTYAPDDLMVKVERMTMAHGLNALSPFHDKDLIEFVTTLPPEQKISGSHRKVILREAIRPLLPVATLEKKKKGFDMPIATWLIKRYPDFVRDVLLDRRTLDRGLFRPEFMIQMVNRFLNGKTDWASGSESTIICLLTLELWFRQFVDK